MKTRRTNLPAYMKGNSPIDPELISIRSIHRLTEHRFKADMWAKIAEEMAIPWRAAEAMHWQIGERGMAQRAGVTPFTFSNVATSPPQRVRRASQPTIGATRRDYPSQVTQLPSVAELTAGIPAYATHPSAGMHTTSPPRSPPSPSTLEAYRTNPRPHERRI